MSKINPIWYLIIGLSSVAIILGIILLPIIIKGVVTTHDLIRIIIASVLIWITAIIIAIKLPPMIIKGKTTLQDVIATQWQTTIAIIGTLIAFISVMIGIMLWSTSSITDEIRLQHSITRESIAGVKIGIKEIKESIENSSKEIKEEIKNSSKEIKEEIENSNKEIKEVIKEARETILNKLK